MNLSSSGLLLAVIWFCSQSLSAESMDLVRDEDYIPFQVELIEEVDTEFGLLRKGERMVIIRPAGTDSIRVEIPRKGILTLPAGVTNLSEEIKQTKESENPNMRLDPRMSFFLANRVVTGESNWQDILPPNVLYASSRWILLYGDARSEATKQAVIAASEYYGALEQSEKTATIFVYMDVPGSKAAIQRLADTVAPTIQCMPGYLSQGYSHSLDHIGKDAELPLLVELASSGRILHKVSGIEQITMWLQQR